MNQPIENESLGLSDELYRYMLSVSLRESELLGQLREETSTQTLARMQLAPEQAQFLAFLVKLTGARRVIEVGVFTGYSSLAVAMALPQDGSMVACDVSEEWTAIARRYWEEAGVSDRIDLRIAPATETLQSLINDGAAGSFDFVFIDADKQSYSNYVDLAEELLRPGGLIAIDNVLWGGLVVDESRQDEETKSIRAINRNLATDDRFDISLVPIGDGVTLLHKRS
jgi:caffeoyl-CoA O-methyltransferase